MNYICILLLTLAVLITEAQCRLRPCRQRESENPIDINSPQCSVKAMHRRPHFWVACCFRPILRAKQENRERNSKPPITEGNDEESTESSSTSLEEVRPERLSFKETPKVPWISGSRSFAAVGDSAEEESAPNYEE